jgi:hypothetical protein
VACESLRGAAGFGEWLSTRACAERLDREGVGWREGRRGVVGCLRRGFGGDRAQRGLFRGGAEGAEELCRGLAGGFGAGELARDVHQDCGAFRCGGERGEESLRFEEFTQASDSGLDVGEVPPVEEIEERDAAALDDVHRVNAADELDEDGFSEGGVGDRAHGGNVPGPRVESRGKARMLMNERTNGGAGVRKWGEENAEGAEFRGEERRGDFRFESSEAEARRLALVCVAYPAGVRASDVHCIDGFRHIRAD